MKRMAAAAVLAVFIHAVLFLLVNHFASGDPVISSPLPKVVTVTMSYRTPALPRENNVDVVKKKPPPKTPEKKDPPKKPLPKPKEDMVTPEPPEIEPPAPEKKEPPVDGNQLQEEANRKDNIPDDAAEDDLESSTHGNSMSNMTAEVEAVPLYKTNPPPQYPRVAVKRGYQGTAELMVLVNANGSVDDVWLFESSGYSILDEAALQSVKHWSFTPGKKGDQAIEMWVRVPVHFQLR